MVNDKILIIYWGEHQNKYFEELNKIDSVDTDHGIYPIKLKFLRIIRRLHYISNIPGIYIWMTDWSKNISQYKTVICIANQYSDRTLRWIRRRNSKVRLIHYYWDELEVSKYPFHKRDSVYETWSFCKDNCEKYDMKYNPQFFVDTLQLSNDAIEYDVSFVGSDRSGTWKGRAPLVEKYYQIFQKNHIKSYMWFVTEAKNVSENIKKSRFMPEKDYFEICSKSKVILEIVEPGKEWITLRPLLALSNGKKLITNNSKIIEEIYYSRENIFILGHDPEEWLKAFIEAPFDYSVMDTIKEHDASHWLQRFLNG